MKTTKAVIIILKRQLILLCAAGAVFAFSCIYMRTEEGNEPVSIKSTSAVSEAEEFCYTIKLVDSQLMVLNDDGLSMLEYTVERGSISSNDLQKLEAGITADSEESLKRLLEDYTS